MYLYCGKTNNLNLLQVVRPLDQSLWSNISLLSGSYQQFGPHPSLSVIVDSLFIGGLIECEDCIPFCFNYKVCKIVIVFFHYVEQIVLTMCLSDSVVLISCDTGPR